MVDLNLVIGLVVLALFVWGAYTYAPRVRAMLTNFELFANPATKKGVKTPAANGVPTVGMSSAPSEGAVAKKAPAALPAKPEGFADYNSSASGSASGSASCSKGCYPREQLAASDLLPADVNSQWAQVNPVGAGEIQGKNFLSAGALIGVNTIGQSLRNPNYQLRSEPPNPQMKVSPWMQSTIEPDLQRLSIDC